MKLRKTRIGLLAAVSTLAAGVALPSAADELAPPVEPIVVEASIAADGVESVVADANEAKSAKKWVLLAIAGGALAGLVKLIGARRVAKVVKDGAVTAARVTAKTATAAAGAVGKTFSSPLRFVALLAGLALFALTGIGFYDIEWIAGLITGAVLVMVGVYGVFRAKGVLKTVSARVRTVKENRN